MLFQVNLYHLFYVDASGAGYSKMGQVKFFEDSLRNLKWYGLFNPF